MDFSAAHAVLQREIDAQRLPGVSAALMRNGELIDSFCGGQADLQSGQALRPDHIHRAFSNTKLIASVLVLLLADQGQFSLDDPVKAWLPAFGRLRVLRVLRPGATRIDDTEPLQRDITLRHLLSHQAELSHGVFDTGTLILARHRPGRGADDPALHGFLAPVLVRVQGAGVRRGGLNAGAGRSRRLP